MKEEIIENYVLSVSFRNIFRIQILSLHRYLRLKRVEMECSELFGKIGGTKVENSKHSISMIVIGTFQQPF